MARTRSKNVPDAVKNAPPLDLSALASATVVTTPRTGGGRFANNPYVGLLRESYALNQAHKNGWRGNAVQGFHVRELNGALRHAGTVLADEGIGVRIRFEFTDDEGNVVPTGDVRSVPEDDRTVLVQFTGTRRRVYLDEDQVKDAIARGFVLKNREGELLLDKDDNPRVDTAAYLKAIRPEPVNGDEDEYDEDEDEDEYDEDEDEEDENEEASDYVSA